jgi:hypothetical protein
VQLFTDYFSLVVVSAAFNQGFHKFSWLLAGLKSDRMCYMTTIKCKNNAYI